MDGVNEPDSLNSNESSVDIEQTYWTNHPSNYFPLKYIIPITRHSALFNTLKQEVFYIQLKARSQKNSTSKFPERTFWRQQKYLPLEFAPADEKSANAIHSYMQTLHAFEDRLKQDNKKYLLLTQPYLAFSESCPA